MQHAVKYIYRKRERRCFQHHKCGVATTCEPFGSRYTPSAILKWSFANWVVLLYVSKTKRNCSSHTAASTLQKMHRIRHSIVDTLRQSPYSEHTTTITLYITAAEMVSPPEVLAKL